MDHDPANEKLAQMTTKILKAETSPAKGAGSETPTKRSHIGYDFIGAVFGCVFLGWIADTVLGTGPWGMILMLMIGFALGMMLIWRALANPKLD